MTFGFLRSMFGMTLRDPVRAVATLRGLDLPMNTRWMMLIVAVALSSLLNWLMNRILSAGDAATTMSVISNQPLMLAALQFAAVVMSAALMDSVGRMFGGTGNFADAVLLMSWIEAMLLVVQLIQLVLVLLMPPLAALMGLVAMMLFVGLTVLFTKELHGFTSVWKVALGVFATALAAGFVLSFIAAAFGLLPEMPA